MSIEDIRRLCNDETIVMTQHTIDRIRERGIKLYEIEETILNGKIIEEYPSDYPYPSCLIFGITINNRYIHVVAGVATDQLFIITAYCPTLDKWENDYITRKQKPESGDNK